MFDLIKFRNEVEVFNQKGSIFLKRKNRNLSYGHILPCRLPDHLTQKLLNGFVKIKVLEIALNSPEEKTNYKALTNGLYFEYACSSNPDIVFFPKYGPIDTQIKFDLDSRGDVSSKTFLQNQEGYWIIDNPLANLSCYMKSEEPSKEFLSLMKHPFFQNENSLDFKDTLFLHETRRRRDKLKGTYPSMGSYNSPGLMGVESGAGKLEVFNIPSTFRKSSRRSSKPLSKEKFEAFASQLLAQQASLSDPYFGDVSKKFYPSAGSAYELQPVFFCEAVVGLERGAYYFDEKSGVLNRLEKSNLIMNRYLESAQKSWGIEYGRPAVLISFVLDPRHYYQKYSQICLSLSLINLGVLFSECYQLASNLDISACALGSTSTDLFFEFSEGDFISLGEFALGG